MVMTHFANTFSMISGDDQGRVGVGPAGRVAAGVPDARSAGCLAGDRV
jgi:hypothetical protein